ncbi:MAG TPA: patatin-like phospholipase family protein [Mycobacteriales bacterium]
MTRIGLVLGAGGVTGEAFHRGVLWALQEAAGFDARSAEVIVGTSAGSLVGASLRCSGMAPRRGALAPPDEARATRLPDPRPLLATLRRPWNARAGVLATALLPAGSRPMDAIVDGLRRRCGDGWPERDLYVCAVRRRDGRRVVFGAPGAPAIGLATAVAASCAIPGFFRPVVHDGETYVDGGVHSPTNADVLAGRGLDLVVISSPMSVERHALRAKLDLSARLLWHRYVVAERRALERAGTPVLVVEPGGAALRALGLNAMRAMNVDAIEDTARAATLELLARPEKAGRVALLAGRRRASA